MPFNKPTVELTNIGETSATIVASHCQFIVRGSQAEAIGDFNDEVPNNPFPQKELVGLIRKNNTQIRVGHSCDPPYSLPAEANYIALRRPSPRPEKRRTRSLWPSERISHEESLPVRRFVRSPKGCSGLRRR